MSGADPRPLAARMRPQTLAECVGHGALIGPGSPLRQAVAAGRLPSLLLWGPPGCGKTTLARLLAAEAGLELRVISAVSGGLKELKEVVEATTGGLFSARRGLALFVDEIHRWNKAQQDALLPLVEEGRLVLIGATTENPAFEVIPALRSRTWLVRLEALTPPDIEGLLARAAADPERGLGGRRHELSAEGSALIASAAVGDARRALGLLERASEVAGPGGRIDGALVARVAGEQELRHDRDGDAHYDVISAFIKSMRGSDPDATIYWLARLLEGGDDPVFVARRIVIAAAEDVGLAEPRALEVAVAASRAAELVGMPEARIPLAEAALFVALAPKSNTAYAAINAAISLVRETGPLPVPVHLRNAPTGLARQLGHGAGYRYPHDQADGFVDQRHLPPALEGRALYRAKRHGAEKVMDERQRWWRERATKAEREPGGS